MRPLLVPYLRQGIRESIVDNDWNISASSNSTLMHRYRKNHEHVYRNKIESQDMRQHLMIDKQRRDFSNIIAAEIDEYYGIMGDYYDDAREQLDFVTSLKGGDDKGRWDGHTRCTGQIQKGSGYYHPEEIKDVLDATATEVGKLDHPLSQYCFTQECMWTHGATVISNGTKRDEEINANNKVMWRSLSYAACAASSSKQHDGSQRN